MDPERTIRRIIWHGKARAAYDDRDDEDDDVEQHCVLRVVSSELEKAPPHEEGAQVKDDERVPDADPVLRVVFADALVVAWVDSEVAVAHARLAH